MDGEVMTTEKSEDNAIFFTKEQFNVGLRSPLPSLFKEFLHVTQIPSANIHPNMVRVLMGCNILSMLFNLDLSLLEVLFIYSLKKRKNDIFSMVAHLPSLQLVTELSDSTKGGAKGHVLVRGAWAGLLEHPERPFSPNRSLVLFGPDKRGCVVEWVEKASFSRLNKLFEITAAERHHETLLTAAKLAGRCLGAPGVRHQYSPQEAAKEGSAWGALCSKRPPFLQGGTQGRCLETPSTPRRSGRKEERGNFAENSGKKCFAPSLPAGAPSKNKKKLVLNKGKEIKLPSPPKEVVIPPLTFVKEITIREPDLPILPSISSGSGCLAGLNHSGPLVPTTGRLALLAKEATSVNQPDFPHPDANAAGAFCAEALPPTAPPMEETRAESQGLPPYEPSPLAFISVKRPAIRRSRPARDLKSGLIGRLQDRFLEAIEVSYSFVQEDHPEGSETEMVVENPTASVVVLDGGSPGETQLAENDGAPDPGEESLPNASLGGVPLMMHLASPLVLSTMRSWERC
ncbi:hypothetical protein CK203_077732 [Vitis vinifera]|uniref:Uncharacterized protein n=1 Tax=Vitis vinifera TaxID=29760 RepID=A0A438BX26_VITVI|nr:hypothetical protein CK203_077732 [Vitis vinifera]